MAKKTTQSPKPAANLNDALAGLKTIEDSINKVMKDINATINVSIDIPIQKNEKKVKK